MAEQAVRNATPIDPSVAPATDGPRAASPTKPAPLDDPRLLVHDLGWSKDEALDTHFRLRPFQDDWEAPGMDAYDER